MIKLLPIVLCIMALSVNAQQIKPLYTVPVSGNVSDLAIDNDVLWACTDNGHIYRFKTGARKPERTVLLPKIVLSDGESVHPKVVDIEYNAKLNRLAVISVGQGGFSHLYLLNGNVFTSIFPESEKLMLKKVLWVNDTQLAVATISNEILMVEPAKKKIVKRFKISTYTFSDMALNNLHTRLVSADESGKFYISDLKNGKLISSHSGKNLDNIYKIALVNNTLIMGGQDRRVGIYRFSPYIPSFLESDFLVYAVGLKSDEKVLAYSCNENNDIRLTSVSDQTSIGILSGHKGIVNSILFYGNNQIVSGADEPLIYYWKY